MKWFKEKPILERWAISTTIIGVVIILWFVFQLIWVGYLNPNNSLSIDNAAKIGDFVGGFVGVFFTIVGVFLLFENLSLQRNDLRESKLLIQLQSFEGALFNMLKTQSEITNQIEYSFILGDSLLTSRGRKVFGLVKDDFVKMYNLLLSKEFVHYGDSDATFLLKIFKEEIAGGELFDEEETGKLHFCAMKLQKLQDDGLLDTDLSTVKEAYSLIFNYYHSIYGHYFRHLYHILKFIKTTEDRNNTLSNHRTYKSYADLVQAQMSSAELFVLFLNGLNFKGMKKLIHEYNFLENLAIEDLLNKEHQEFYSSCKIDNVDYSGITFKSRMDLIH